MDNLQWIKELVRSELANKSEQAVDFQAEYRTSESLKTDTIAYLTELKARFVAACSAFNQLKGSENGRIKIYGISKTEADFMIFRNGYKLIFSMRDPGKIIVNFNHVGSNFILGQEDKSSSLKVMGEDLLLAQWKAFGRLTWTHQEQEIETDYLIRHYLSRFIKLSIVSS